jgi:hypothetical protein
LARCSGHRAAIDHRSLAPIGLADLAPEVKGGPTTDSAGTAQADSTDGHREPDMGRGANCQRAAGEAWDSGLAADSAQVHAEATARPAAW